MAKIQGPLHSDSANGAFGKSMIFRKGKKGTTLARYYKPGIVNKFTPSQAQVDLRTNYGLAVEAWRALTTAEKEEFNLRAKQEGGKMSGWNLYLKEYLALNPILEWGEEQTPMSWQDADALAISLGEGWRLPTDLEIQDRMQKQIDLVAPVIFEVYPQNYWTSIPDPTLPNRHRVGYIIDNTYGSGETGDDTICNVRFVRV